MSTNIQLDIIPFHDNFAHCLDECMISVANYYGRNYILMFAQAWGFSFNINDDQSNSIGNSLNADRGDVYNLLAFYHGIQTTFVNNKDPLEVINTIGKELENNNPVGVLMDTYYYSWDPNNSQHGSHWFLITGIDTENKLFYCTDPYFQQQGALLSFKDVINRYLGTFFTFKLVKNEITEYDWKSIINLTINKLEGKTVGKSIFDNMIEFADYVEKYFCLHKETATYHRIIDMPYFINLQAIFRGRQQFVKYLEHIASKYYIKDLFDVSEKLKQISYKWDAIRGVITKSILASDESIIKLKVPSKVKEIARCEADILNLLVSITASNSCQNTYSTKNIKEISNECNKIYNFDNYSYLELSKYYNNNGFGSILNTKSKANLNGAGLFFVAEDIPAEELWMVNEMKFKFPKVTDGLNDNISCSGQIIKTPSIKCKSLMLLGTADFGSFKESITIHYDDGSTEEITIGFTEYIFKPIYEEFVAWDGRACERINNSIQIHNFKVKIFAKTYELNKSGIITQITLPYLPNIHIFSITMT